MPSALSRALVRARTRRMGICAAYVHRTRHAVRRAALAFAARRSMWRWRRGDWLLLELMLGARAHTGTARGSRPLLLVRFDRIAPSRTASLFAVLRAAYARGEGSVTRTALTASLRRSASAVFRMTKMVASGTFGPESCGSLSF